MAYAEPTFTSKFGGRDPVVVFGEITRSVLPQREDLQEAGNWLVGRIKERTLQGSDVHGNAFAPYSPEYAYRKRTSTTAVDLYGNARDGVHMLDAVQAVVVPGVGGLVLSVGIVGNARVALRGRALQTGWTPLPRISWKGRKELGRVTSRQLVKRRGAVPPREWLGASEQEMVTMRGIIVQSVMNRLQRLRQLIA